RGARDSSARLTARSTPRARSRRRSTPDAASSRGLGELAAIGARLSEKMAGAAFPLWIVIRGFGRMARGAERSAGSQLRDGCRRVARVASLVRDLESRVRGLRIGECVASRTRAAGRVMVGVAVLALGDGRRWRECDRSRVTLDALPLGML